MSDTASLTSAISSAVHNSSSVLVPVGRFQISSNIFYLYPESEDSV